MKKSSLFLVLTVIAVAFTACNDNKTKQLESQRDSLLIAQQSQQEIINDMYSTLGEVSLTLDSISANDGLLQFKNAEGKMLTKDQIRANLNSYKQLLADSKAKLAELESKLAGSSEELQRLNGIIKFLESELAKKDATINELLKELDQKNVSIARLTGRVEELKTVKDSLSIGLADTKETLNQVVKQMDAVYYIVADKSTLNSMKLLVSGGFAHRRKLDSKNLTSDGMIESSVNELTELTIDSKEPEILTTHPKGSYEIINVSKSKCVLHITDKVAFWKNSKYLVIRTD